MSQPDREQIFLAMFCPNPCPVAHRCGLGAYFIRRGTGHLHASVTVGFIVIAKIPEIKPAADRPLGCREGHIIGAAIAGHDDDFHIVLCGHLAA